MSEIRPADPGSLKAKMHGCICYALDTPGAFAIMDACPMHGSGLDPKAWEHLEKFRAPALPPEQPSVASGEP